ncbi:MAG: YIP1 family protein [Anaerolineales bacterium]|jgi:hypothetical protein
MIRELFGFIWGIIIRPKATFDDLGGMSSIRPAVMLVILVQLLSWLNLLIYTIFGQDWLGTRRELPDPTYVGFFGRLAVNTENYVSIYFFVIAPLLALLGLVVVPGLAHVLSKIWRGQGTFEQMVNALIFAQVPSILLQTFLNDMILAGIPANLLFSHPYAFTAAMNGEFGQLWSMITWIYMIGIYILGTGLWVVILGAMAIHRIQRIPRWSAATITLFSYLFYFYGLAGSFVR